MMNDHPQDRMENAMHMNGPENGNCPFCKFRNKVIFSAFTAALNKVVMASLLSWSLLGWEMLLRILSDKTGLLREYSRFGIT